MGLDTARWEHFPLSPWKMGFILSSLVVVEISVLLQILKETGARCGEAWNLRWTDIDSLII